MDKPERLELKSVDGAQLNLDALYQIAPSCFTEAKDPKTGKIKRVVNFDVLRQLLGDDTVEDAPEAYEFNWVGKQEARAEVLRPINKTLRPVKEDSVDWDNTQNLYIEGDNLEVLKLLQKSYLGKVKMIYIDPPYNTGNDFVYHDDFAKSQAEYDEASGAVDELGNRYWKNTDSNGKYHSDWCSMIYSRLMVAKTLLSKDGAIFASIDDHEVRNLKNIFDEVFGEANFIGQIVVAKGTTTGQDANGIGSSVDYMLFYAKDKENFVPKGLPLDEEDKARFNMSDEKGLYSILQYRKTGTGDRKEDRPNLFFPLTAPDGSIVYPIGPGGYESRWRADRKQYDKWNQDNMIYWKKDNSNQWKPYVKYYLEGRTKQVSNLWDDVEGNKKASITVKELLGKNIFDFPKPVGLIRKCLAIAADSDSIILDFFSGSATTAHSVMQLNAEDGGNRKFIMVQLTEETPEDSEAYKAGYKNICEIGKERIRRAGKKIKEEHPDAKDLDTGFRVFRIDESNFEDVERTPKEYNQDQLDLFLNNVKSDRNDLDLLFGCMLDWGVQLSLPMASEEVDGKMIYTVNDGDLVACFAEKVTDSVVKAMADKQPLRVIFRDSCFEQDADKINIYETFKQLLDWSDKDVEKNIRVI
jgi:adenine-specific DNA-methyltransferase